MRCIVLIQIILLLVACYTYAQDSKPPRDRQWELRVNGGLDNSNIVSDGERVGATITFPYLGPGIKFPISQNWNIEAYGLFGNRGTSYENPFYKQRLMYLDIPVKLRYKIIDGLQLYGGGQYSYFLGENTYVGADREKPEDLEVPTVSNVDLMAQIGFGLTLGKYWDLNFSYNRSLTAIHNNYHFSMARVGVTYNIGKDILPDRAETEAPKFGKAKENEQASKASIAHQHARKLKNGVLLVRLNSSNNQIQELLDQGKYREAYRVELNQKLENEKVISAFNSQYTFSRQTYFFHNHESKAIKNDNYQDVVFNANGMPLNSPIDDSSRVYIATMGNIWFDDFQQYFSGIAILDHAFNQLKDPFPYFVRNYRSLGFLGVNRDYASMVDQLNKNLKDYYKEQSFE